jgi:hypothetical protein
MFHQTTQTNLGLKEIGQVLYVFHSTYTSLWVLLSTGIAEVYPIAFYSVFVTSGSINGTSKWAQGHISFLLPRTMWKNMWLYKSSVILEIGLLVSIINLIQLDASS